MLSPHLFIAVLDLISRKAVVKDPMKKNSSVQATWPWWRTASRSYRRHWTNELFTRHGLKMNLQKREILHIGNQREELDIELEGKKLTQGECFVYLGGVVCGDSKTERERGRERGT